MAVFSHGYAIRLVLAALQGYSVEQLAQTPVGDNTAVSLLEAKGEKLRVVFRDDNSHLQTPEFLAGETVKKRANGLEPGLYFLPLRLPEQAEKMVELVSASWEDARPFDRDRLLADAALRPTLMGYLDGEPVGLVQFGPESGCISLACIRPDCRRRGFGVQLIGQAVQHTRPRGGRILRITLAAEAKAQKFFRENGFAPMGTTADGREILEKNVGYDPEILGK